MSQYVVVDHDREDAISPQVVTGPFPTLEAAKEWVLELGRDVTWSEEYEFFVDDQDDMMISIGFLHTPEASRPFATN